MQWENLFKSSLIFIIILYLFRKIFLFFLDDKIRFTQKKAIFAFKSSVLNKYFNENP